METMSGTTGSPAAVARPGSPRASSESGSSHGEPRMPARAALPTLVAAAVCLAGALQADPARGEDPGDPWASVDHDLGVGVSLVGIGLGAAGLVGTGIIVGSEGIDDGYDAGAFLLLLFGSLTAGTGGATGLGILEADADIPGWVPWTLFFGGGLMAGGGGLMVALKADEAPGEQTALLTASPANRASPRAPAISVGLTPSLVAHPRATPAPGLLLSAVW